MPEYVMVILKHVVRFMTATLGGLGAAKVIQIYTKRRLPKLELDKWAIAIMLIISVLVTLLYFPSKNIIQLIYEPLIYWLLSSYIYLSAGDKIFEIIFKIMRKGK